MNNNIQITRNLNETQKDDILNIVYEAFEKKINLLELAPKSKEQALRMMKNSVNFEYGFYAIENDKVVGGAGLQYDKHVFYRYSFKMLLKEFGLFGALTRFIFNSLSNKKIKPKEIYIKAVAVAPQHRGKKIGSLILNSVFDFAKQNGYEVLSLDVVNTNESAHRLYKRLGFVDVKEHRYGFITCRAGFTGSCFMEKHISQRAMRCAL